MPQGRLTLQPKVFRGGNMSARLPRHVPVIRQAYGLQTHTFQRFRKPQ